MSLSCRDKDEDEGVPCESEFEKKLSDTRIRALKGKELPRTELEKSFQEFTAIVAVGFVGPFPCAQLKFFRGMGVLHPANGCSPCLHLTLFTAQCFVPAACSCCARLQGAELCHCVPLDGASISGIALLPSQSFCFQSSFLFSAHPRRTTSAEG